MPYALSPVCCNAARDGGRVGGAKVVNAVCVITLCLNAARDGGHVDVAIVRMPYALEPAVVMLPETVVVLSLP